jgi:hypothetical protein
MGHRFRASAGDTEKTPFAPAAGTPKVTKVFVILSSDAFLPAHRE